MTTAASIAAHGLSTDAAPPAELDDLSWRALLEACERHRLVGLLAAAAADGALALDADRRAELEAIDERWQRHALVMERTLLDVVASLDERGIDHRVIKGPALARVAYDDPSHRVFGDLDLLVPADRLADTRALLVREHGAVDPFPELRPGFDAAFAKDVLIQVDGLEVDLHRTLAAGPFGHRIPTAELFEGPASFAVGDVTVRTLGPAATFVQVCYNASLGDIPPRLSSLRDVAQVHRSLRPDTDAVVALADRWGGAAVVATAIRLTWDTLGLRAHEVSEWAASHRPGALDRRHLAASRSTARSYTRHLASVAAIRGVGPRLRYVRAIVRPDPAYLEARGWTGRAHVGRAVRRLLRR